jgi:hypothetical protein
MKKAAINHGGIWNTGKARNEQYQWHLVNFGVRQKKTKHPNHKMPVQPLLDRHRNHHPLNGIGIAIFWTASTATAAATDTTNATQPMEEALATATATHPMEEPSHKMTIMRLKINKSI